MATKKPKKRPAKSKRPTHADPRGERMGTVCSDPPGFEPVEGVIGALGGSAACFTFRPTEEILRRDITLTKDWQIVPCRIVPLTPDPIAAAKERVVKCAMACPPSV